MKLLLAFLSLFFVAKPAETLVILDKDLKKPRSVASDFTLQLYLHRFFPVYAADVPALVTTLEQAVKAIDKDKPCEHTISLGADRTTLRIDANCEGDRSIDVTLITSLAETSTSYSFALVRNEADKRRVQRKLLDLVTYLNKE